MAQAAGSAQSTGSGRHGPARPSHGSHRRARLRLRLDTATFALAVGLAAVLAIGATASLNGFEIAGVSALPLTEQRGQSTTDSESNDIEVIVASRADETSETSSSTDDWAHTDSDGRVRYETERTALLGAAALDQLRYDWQTMLPSWRIDFIEGNDRVAGYTWSQEARIEVFVRPTATSADIARILAHELGHAVDVTLNTAEERTTWLRQRSSVETPWWPSSGAADFETGAGDFAECFAVWLIGPADYRSVVGPVPSEADLALIAQLAG